MFSNKTRFSFASVVVLLAFALLLVPAAVEAQLSWSRTESDLNWAHGSAITHNLPTAQGAEGNITYGLTPSLPNDLSFSTAGVISGTIAQGKATTAYTLTASAPGETAITQTFNITVHSPAVVVGSPSNQVATVGTAFSLVLPVATQEDGDTTTYTLTGSIPDGLTFAEASRTLAGTPTTAAAAVTLTYTAVDSGSQTGDGNSSNTFTLAVNPAVPTGVTAAAGVGKITVTWTGGANSGFEYEKDSGAWTAVGTYPLELTGPAGTEISVRIRVAAAGSIPASTPSAAATATPTPPAPAAPTGVAAAAGVGNIRVTWANGANSGFEYSQDSGAWTAVGTYPLELTGPAGTEISVRIRVAAAGQTPAGTPSAAVSATPTNPQPAAPTSVAAAAGVGNIRVTWANGANSGFEYSQDSGAWTAVSAYPLVLTGPAGTPISVRIRVAAAVNTPASTPSAAATATPTPPPPPAPTGVTAAAGVGNIRVTWDSGANSGFEYSQDSGGAWTAVSTYPLELTGPAGTPISVRIRVAAAGQTPAGTPSDPATATPLPGSGPPPVPLPPTGVRATAGDEMITVTWNGGASETASLYDYSKDSGAWTPVSRYPLEIEGPNGTPISARIRVARSGNTPAGTPSDPVTATPRPDTVPPAPTGVTAAAGPGKITVTWDGGMTTAHDYSTDNGVNWPAVSTYPLEIEGPAGTPISVRIRVAAAGQTPAGTPSDPATATPGPPLPAAPTGVAAAAGVGNIRVTWDSGANSGFDYSRDNGAWTAVGTYPLVLTGPANTPISVRIRVAAAGQTPAGTPSAAATATPLSDLTPPIVRAEPGPGKITVRWERLPNTRYEYSKDDGNWTAVGSTYPLEIEGPAGTPISVRIRVAAAGQTPAGTPSDPATATPLDPRTPLPPDHVTAEDGDGKITVRWERLPNTRYEYSKDGGNWTAVGSTYPLDLTGPNGIEISVRIRVAAAGEIPAGIPSDRVVGIPTGLPPHPPVGVTAAPGRGKITVTWDGGMTTAHDYSTDNGVNWTAVSTYPLEIEGPAGTPISVRIRVAQVRTTPAGRPSDPVTATPLPVLQPPRPMGVTATAGDGEITVTWPDCSTDYEYSTDHGEHWTSVSTCPLVIPAPNGTEVTVEIRKKAANGVPAGGATSVTLTLPPDGIPAHGYAVFVHSGATGTDTGISDDVKTIEVTQNKVVGNKDMPDLWDFFHNDGTIIVKGPAGAAVGDLKITEIMAAKDATLGGRSKYCQWIEVYNRTDTDIDFRREGWMLDFRQGSVSPVPAAVSASAAGRVDLMSNTGNPGYWDIKSTGGRTEATPTAPAVDLVSMYRKLKHLRDRSHADHAKDDGDPEKAATWLVSIRPSQLFGRRVGSPGFHHVEPPAPKTVPSIEVLINEIGNSSTDANDWVELMNTTNKEVNLKKWELNIVRAGDSGPEETQLVSFPDNDNTKLPAKGILLITHSDPTASGNDLAAGVAINKAAADRVKRGVQSLYYVDSKLVLPNDNSKYNLILRNANDKEGKPTHIVDHGGTYFAEKDDDTLETEVWPLQLWAAGHGNVIDGADEEDFRAGRVYQRNGMQSGIGEKHWKKVGFTGIGYDRTAAKTDENGGTPGYANDALKDKLGNLDDDADIAISEIMFSAGSGKRSLPQWIELYNSSLTQGVNLNGWKLEIQNARHEDLDARQNATLTLGAVTIAPNQTVLIVSTSGSNSGKDHFPDTRTIDLWTSHRTALDMEARTDTVLSAAGFYLKLIDKDQILVDEVGNTDGNRRTDDAPDWALPMGVNSDGDRVSMIRRYDDGSAEDGTVASGWFSAENIVAYAVGYRELTYYGDSDDVGTPGFHGGGPLPVSLSSFRPARDTATGEVRIRWITESELNNAGFNILRSETKTGEFAVVNLKGIIPGHGTTAEKHAYTWTDASAKPNVVYYYQIEDVSLDGTRTTLRTTHLRGNVNAAGKLTTTWGDLKTQD